jgi:predicted DNA-binding protein
MSKKARRLMVTLTEEQIQELAGLSEDTGASMAEHVRRAIDQYIDQKKKRK